MADSDYMSAQGMPNSTEIERSLLGAVLLDNELVNEAMARLKPEDFYLDAHRRAYAAMMRLSELAHPIDAMTLAEELLRNKELDAVGGLPFLSSLTDGVPRASSIDYYIQIVKDKATLRNLIRAANGIVAQAYEQSGEVAEILDAAESSIYEISDMRGTQELRTIGQIANDAFAGDIEKLFERGKKITGIETHYSDLDEMTSGFQPSDLLIIAARPSMGKTAFAINIAENAAIDSGKKVAIFSLEMSCEALLNRLLCSQARVDAHKMRTGFFGQDDIDALRRGLNRLITSSIYIDDTAGISLTELRSKARRMKQTMGLDLIVIDYMQLMSASAPGGKRYENRNQEVSAISRGLKAIAKELSVPVVALSQLSRAPESRGAGRDSKDTEPKLSDLRESGSIEQDADVVMFLYRPDYYNRDDPTLEGKAKLIVAKQRNGPTGTIQLAFLRQFTRFETLDREQWIH